MGGLGDTVEVVTLVKEVETERVFTRCRVR